MDGHSFQGPAVGICNEGTAALGVEVDLLPVDGSTYTPQWAGRRVTTVTRRSMSETTRLHVLLMRTRRDDVDALRAARSMVRDACTLGRLAVKECNGEHVPQDLREREAHCVRRIETWCTRFGLKASFNGDPRGYPVKITGLVDAYGRPTYNTWGGAVDGWGIGEPT
tara:strand:- start:5 stop:505 length:501 start_codon:yes stop_codon:yes gene_type:complete